MRYGIYLPHVSRLAQADAAERIRVIAQAADGLGFDSVWAGEHIILPVAIPGKDPYTASGKFGLDPSEPILDTLSVLAYVAAITRRVKLGTSVLALPFRNAILTAKIGATLDVLSGGRLILGVAPGWLEPEFRLLGVPFEKRAALTDESIEVIKELWTSEDPRYAGEFYRFADCRCEPRPVQKPHPPIWVGDVDHSVLDARADALRRVVKYGDGWLAVVRTPDEYRERREELDLLARQAGRPTSAITMSVSPRGKRIEALADDIPQYAALGAEHVWFSLGAYTAEFADMVPAMERFARRVGLG